MKNLRHNYLMIPLRLMAAAVFISIYIMGSTSQAQEVIATSGGDHQAGGRSLSWTLGEVATESLSAGSFILTQGFHQPTLTVVSVPELADPGLSIRAFPNPADDYLSLHIDHEEPESFRYVLGDVRGRPVISDRMQGHESQLQLSSLPPGIYLLTVILDNKAVHTFQIIKR